MPAVPVRHRQPTAERVRASRPLRWAAVLGASAAWAIAVPYLGRLVGVRLDVPASVEVADHVVPGLVVLAAIVVLMTGRRRRPLVAPGDLRWSIAAAASFLAGFWIASTHLPLVVEAIGGVTPWDAALLHASAGLPVLGTGAWMLLEPLLRRV